ncbi:hypothetical protein KMZ68_02080 [Bradyrhizobium sediminis]|uniref:Uncharacterized protein n=1 Tax=Bradyrhizobium sediminis TaxID=2840469 RepID=A0A975NRE8_9BRAD|nr:hypothetical protein [Bradyrhizobium sediminis]QWG18709.1 hypothetical protein KMZ68_02080 [Bradyrhizobium sediminis]
MTLPKPRPCLRRVQAAVDSLLSAEFFSASELDSFARRDTYPDAASYLAKLADARFDLISRLYESQPVLAPYRFAVVFGVIPFDRNLPRTYTVADLREKGTQEANLALIALGEQSDWDSMNRRERAVFVLRRLVRAMRDR